MFSCHRIKFSEILVCPLGSFFYNGSCYYYLPPKQVDELKGIGFGDVSVDEGINSKFKINEKVFPKRKLYEYFLEVIDDIWITTE